MILDNYKAAHPKSEFWALVAALRVFVSNEGWLPVSGKVLDMTSTTEFYIDLQRIYKEKANWDLANFTTCYMQVLEQNKLQFENLEESIKIFCENVGISGLEITDFRSM